jgi:2-C-methyl-D-erythritol 4-phosphate cytidylyltransferase
VEATPERSEWVCALTPQAFRVGVLRDALARAEADGFRGTDCASLVERSGLEVRTCPGSPGNFKVTSPPDLERAALVLERRR